MCVVWWLSMGYGGCSWGMEVVHGVESVLGGWGLFMGDGVAFIRLAADL